MSYFIFNQQQIPYNSLANVSQKQQDTLSYNQQQALNIALQWQNGEDTFVVHTSGSTGQPKPIEWKRKFIEKSAKQTLDVFDIQPDDKILLCLSVQTAGGIMMLIRGIIANLPIAVVEPSGNPLATISAQHNYTLASFVPLQMHHMLTGYDFSSVQKLNKFRKVLVGGASMNNDWSKRFTDLDPDFYHTYGMTETYTHIALRKLNGEKATPRFVPMKGIQVSKDREERLVINGEITGYADIVTNDRVIIHTDGSFEILGRIDNVINSGGIKIQLEKIDNALARLKQLAGRTYFTWYVDDKELGQKLIAIIKGEPLDPMDEYEAKVDLRSFLEKYEVPKVFYYIHEFVLTDSGKVQRQHTADKVLQQNK